MEGKINHIVVDEAHKIFLEDAFQSSFLQIKDLAQFSVQKIFLSATLPPFLEEHFFRMAALPWPFEPPPHVLTFVIMLWWWNLRSSQRMMLQKNFAITLRKKHSRNR